MEGPSFDWPVGLFFVQSLLLLGPDQVVDFGVGLDNRPVLFVLGVEHFGVFKMVNQAIEPLQSGIGQYTNLHNKKVTFSLLNLPHLLL